MSLGSSFGTDRRSVGGRLDERREGRRHRRHLRRQQRPVAVHHGLAGHGRGRDRDRRDRPDAEFPGVDDHDLGRASMPAVNANEHPYTGPISGLTIKTISTTRARRSRTSRSAAPSPTSARSLPNTIAVVNRGTCARVAKAIFGQQAGAAAVVMVNNATRPSAGRGPDHVATRTRASRTRHDPVPRGPWRHRRRRRPTAASSAPPTARRPR